MLVNLVLGDWSGDGHEKTDSVTYKVNLSETELKASFETGLSILDNNKDGVKRRGYSLPICEDYEDSRLPADFLVKLKACGLDPIDYIDEWSAEDYLQDPDSGASVDRNQFAKLWLDVAKLGNAILEYEEVQMPHINIGGYGLFY